MRYAQWGWQCDFIYMTMSTMLAIKPITMPVQASVRCVHVYVCVYVSE